MAIHTPDRKIRTRQYVVNIEVHPDSVKEKSLTSTSLPSDMELRPMNDIKSELLGNLNVDDHPDINSETPLVLSSTGTASTGSSPGIIDDIWDSPLPSSHHLSSAGSSVALTPLTPQSAHIATPDSTPAPRAYKTYPVKCVEEGAARDGLAYLSASHGAKTDLLVDVTQDEDYFFKPQKLIRNLTKELQAITDANAAAAQPRYNLRPDFNFGGAAGSRTSSRSQRAMVTTIYDARIESKLHIEVIGTAAISSNNNSLLRTRTAPSLELQTLEQIVPMTIQSRVVEKHGKCVASKVGKPHERCSSNGPGRGIDLESRDLSRCNVEVDPLRFLAHIDRLIGAVMCGTHRNVARSSSRQKKLKAWVTDFTKLTSGERTEFQAWVNAIGSGHLPVGVPTPTVHPSRKDTKSAASKTFKPRDEPVAPSTTKSSPSRDTWKQEHHSGFTPYQPKRTKGKTISDALREEIEKPLPLEQKDGFIYVFWDKEHFGKVKIGRTKNLELRLKQWDKACKRQHMYHPVTLRDEFSEIPHVNRIERLIHIELKECRKKRYCQSCDKDHIEWFDVGEASVTKVLRKWQDWILQRPYALDSITQRWKLRPEVMKTLDQVCEPVVLAEKQPPLRRTSGTKGQRKSKRRTI